MSYANYAHCEVCDGKIVYVGDEDTPEGAIVLHADCDAKRQHDLMAAARAEGYRQAVATLADMEKYTAWLRTRTPVEHESYVDRTADYLVAHAPTTEGHAT